MLISTSRLVFLETTSSSNEEDSSAVRLRTPPSASAISSVAVRRELLADVGIAENLAAVFGLESEGFRIIPTDLGKLLSSGTAASLGKSTALVMGPTLHNGLDAAEAIEQLRALIPHVGIYVVARATADVARTLPRLAMAGVDDVFTLETKADVMAFESTIRPRLAAPAPETEIRLLWKWFRESSERSLVMHCVRNGYRLDVWQIRSKVFNACRKTLQNRMAVLTLPSPGILSRCGRVLHAQELERRGVKPTATVAAILGFPSAGAMQRARRRLRKALMSRGRQALVFASLLK